MDSPLIGFLGRLHPATVHFPIALLAAAALFEALQILRKKPALSPATVPCTMVGAAGALVAILFGWFLEEYDGESGDLFDLHKWIGIASAAVAVAAAAVALKARFSPRALTALRLLLFLGAAGTGAAGYLGGELVFGRNHLFGVFKEKPPPPAPLPLLKPVGTIDFAAHIAPILDASCLKCHGREKVKGKLNLMTREGFLKGGGSGPAVTPGKPDESTLYSLLVEADPDIRMPPEKEPPLRKEQIDQVRAWIEQGASWPEGFEFK